MLSYKAGQGREGCPSSCTPVRSALHQKVSCRLSSNPHLPCHRHADTYARTHTPPPPPTPSPTHTYSNTHPRTHSHLYHRPHTYTSSPPPHTQSISPPKHPRTLPREEATSAWPTVEKEPMRAMQKSVTCLTTAWAASGAGPRPTHRCTHNNTHMPRWTGQTLLKGVGAGFRKLSLCRHSHQVDDHVEIPWNA